MKAMRKTLPLAITVALVLPAAMVLPAGAQQEAEPAEVQQQPEPAELVVEPGELVLEVGETAQLTATVQDASGNVLEFPVVFFSRSRRSVGVTPTGAVEAYRPGEFMIVARVPMNPEETGRRAEARIERRIAVTIPTPPITKVEWVNAPARYYSGTSIRPTVVLTDSSGAKRSDVEVEFSSSDPSVVEVSSLGRFKMKRTGTAQITASAEEASVTISVNVAANPTTTLTMQPSATEARTGDVIHLNATALDAQNREVPDLPIQYSFSARTVDYERGEAPSGMISEDGRFVADVAGEYTLVAVAGDHTTTENVHIVARDVKQEIELVGWGRVSDRRTSDLWVWEGIDGRDYAITGTHSAEGHAYIWDVTDPSNMVIIDTLRVDARTVNDVKVSEDGRIAVISREGASNRRNGLVILDVSNPAETRVLARYDDQLTGGVHNLFVFENHVYALSAGRRYDVINIEDPSNPYRVGSFELDTPGHGIHDVWVEKGIAYSSNWTDGVVAVDVGGGDQGGSPNNPVMLGSYAYPSGWNHAAFPYRSKSTGKFYAFAGDEYLRHPDGARGWIHVIEWDEWDQPREVARYEVPEAGTHNLWIEDDILYVAYYQGGLRVVDVSGELMGDLYRQGREIAMYRAKDPEAYRPNSPMAWGPQPYKGLIFFSDFNSGLWAVRLKPKESDE